MDLSVSLVPYFPLSLSSCMQIHPDNQKGDTLLALKKRVYYIPFHLNVLNLYFTAHVILV